MFLRVYHISRIHNRQSILEKGLIPYGKDDEECRWPGLGYPPRIYVSLRKTDAWAMDFVDYEGVDVWSFVVLKRELKKDHHSGCDWHYYIERPVPPAALRLAETVDYFPRVWPEGVEEFEDVE